MINQICEIMYTLQNDISFLTTTGQKVGKSLIVNSYPRIMFVAVMDGFMIHLYEHVSGLKMFSCEAFTIDEIMCELSIKGKGLNYEKLYTKLTSYQAVIGFSRTNTPLRIRNTNIFFEEWKAEKTIIKESLPYVYSEIERKEIYTLIDLARENGFIEFSEFLERQANRKRTGSKIYLNPVQNFKNSYRFMEEQRFLKKLQEDELPYPISYHGKKGEATFNGFKSLINESRKRDITKNIPNDIFRLLFGAYFLTTLVNNAYGYHLRKLPYLTGVIIGIKSKKRIIDNNLLIEYKGNLIDYCMNSFKNISINLILGDIQTRVIMLKSVTNC